MTLGGAIFVYNAIKQDYSFREAILCLQALCDEVVIVDAGSTDGTLGICQGLTDNKTYLISVDESEWLKIHGREKLSFFQNIAIGALTTDWAFLLQGDEVVGENCFASIRSAIENQQAEAYFVSRINLWGDSQHQLDVPHTRSPVGTKIIRLARTYLKSVDDGESIEAFGLNDYINKIRIYHTGFIRDKHKHLYKIRHMQGEVFEIGVDKKIDGMNEGFDPWVHFSKEDVISISEPLPSFIQQWAIERDKINKA